MDAAPPLLLCHTDPATRHAIDVALARTYDLAFAHTPRDVATIATALNPAVILCDLTDAALAVMDAWSDGPDPAAVLFTHAAAAAPLVSRAYQAGAAHCLPKPLDTAVLRTLVRRCLDDRAARRAADRLARRIEKELADARRLQRGMMPPADRRLAGASVAARWQPSAELGGDLFDFAEIAPHTLALLIADVSGHGVAPALLTTLVKTAFRAAAPAGHPPAAVAAAVAQSLAPFGAERFVTLVAARLDTARHTIEYANAGHPAPLVFRHGRVLARLDPTGPLIGPGVPDATWDAATLPIPPSGGLLLYTDGLTDAQGDAGRFGHDRLLDALARHPAGGAPLLDGILASVAAFSTGHPLADDITLLTTTTGLPGLA